MNGSPSLRITPIALAGAFVVEPIVHCDERGSFVKTFHAGQLAEAGLRFEMQEEFYSISRRGVLRGMHFQIPPHAHQKLVSCIAGRVLDVLVDLRRTSATYGEACSMELSAKRPQLLWIPRGLAHGFLSLEDSSCVTYKTDSEHAPDCDGGIHWDSFGFEWPDVAEEFVIAPRDRQHPRLADFHSPFVAESDLGAG